jgi:hypothetical protein
MARRLLTSLVIVPALALSACGSDKKVDASSYTCADFNKSLATKGNDTAGNFINRVREQAKLGQDEKTEHREVSLGIFFACRGKPAVTRPAKEAVTIAQQIKAGKFKLPSPPSDKKRSGK